MPFSEFSTKGGLNVRVEKVEIERENALDSILSQIDDKKGAVFSSGFDYPGRHSRWEIGFVDPAVEFSAKKRDFEFNGLNEQGLVLIPMIETALSGNPHIATLKLEGKSLLGTLHPPASYFAEEERSKQASIFSVLRVITELLGNDQAEAAHFGMYGAFGYDLVTEFEDLELRLPRTDKHPDCLLYIPLELTVVDRKKEISARYSYSVETPQGHTSELQAGGEVFSKQSDLEHVDEKIISDHSPSEFASKVAKIIEGTKRGDYFEVVLSQSFSTGFNDKATSLFKRLAKINPSPYMFLLNFGDEQLVGASPELYVRVTGRRYETCPIAGTVRRGATALEDADQVRELISSRKDESELTMCTDVDRNDMARVCVPGSVRIIGRRQLEFYSHLIHTVDHVEGTLAQGFDALDAFQTHMWACTVTGAPKPAALQAIENLENSPRGWYSGAIGFLSFNGDINTGITLRTATLKDNKAILRAGATLLFGSDPKLEEEETRTKAAAFLAALAKPDEAKIQKKLEKKSVPRVEKISGKQRRILLVDCKDSFVHNLAAYLRELGTEVITLRSGFPLSLLDELAPDLVFLSPGPGTPDEFGIPNLIGEVLKKELPIFGVCLGHQGIGQHFGAELAQLPIPEHGKPAKIAHNEDTIFTGIKQGFEVGRYHSLYLKADSMPDCLQTLATTIRVASDGTEEIIPMAIRHRSLPVAGVQFHPESLMTLKQTCGHIILKNAIESLT